MSKPALKNDVFIRSLLRQSVPYTPVWMMRQAGRYLPEYNATRAEAGSFLNLAKSPELATEVTLQPLRRFPLDAAILFSDILTIPDAMGLGLRFETGEGPKFDRPLRSEEDIRQLPSVDLNELRYVFDAVTMIRHELDGQVPLIGFSGSPWTLACYMVEGGGSSDYRQIKTLMYQRPDLMHHILAINAQSVAEYLNEQVKAGAQALMIFDSWGGVLADGLYQQFSLFYMKEVISRLIREVDGTPIPVIIFTKGGGMWLEDMLDSGCDAIGVDWTVNLGRARSRLGDKVALQGNLDPMTLFGSKQSIEDEVKRTLDSVGVVTEGAGHVFNLGHGISQFTNPDAASVLVETVHSYSRQYHS